MYLAGCRMMITPLTLLVLACVSYTSGQTAEFKLTAYGSKALENPGTIEEDSLVRLECKYPTISEAVVVTVIMEVKDSDGEEWSKQVECAIVPPPLSITKANGVGNLIFSKDNVTCQTTSLIVELNKMESTFPKYYQCRWKPTVDGRDFESREITLRTHKTPTSPSLQQIPSGTPLEGTSLTFRCTSQGRPPPKLQLSYSDGTIIPDSELQHQPSLDFITEDSPESTSMLTWSTTAKKSMHDRTLQCKIGNHPSKNVQKAEQLISVYYGPNNGTNQQVDWNLETNSTAVIQCSLDSNGYTTYEWFNSTLNHKLSTTAASLTLDKLDFTHITGDTRATKVYICKATNNDNNAKVGHLQITVTIYTTEKPNKGDDERITDPEKAGLEPWAIAIISVGGILIVVVVITVAVVCKRRQSSSAAQKKKEAASKKGKGNSAYQNQNGENTQNLPPDVIGNSYGLPESPVAMQNAQDCSRYSQNVEDLGNLIHDEPRSRKGMYASGPIDYVSNELFEGPPSYEGGPPGYQPHPDSTLYLGTSALHYGAPC